MQREQAWTTGQGPGGTRALLPRGPRLSHCTALPPAEGWAQQSPGGSQHPGNMFPQWSSFHMADCTGKGGVPVSLTTVVSLVTPASPCRWLKVRTGSFTPEVAGCLVGSPVSSSFLLTASSLVLQLLSYDPRHLPQRRPRPLGFGSH